MIQVFLNAFSSATEVALTIFAWLLVMVGLVLGVAVLAFVLAVLFDAATGFLRWFWRLTHHQPRGRIQRIIMGVTDAD